MNAAPSRCLFVGPLANGAVGGATVKNRLLFGELEKKGVELAVVDTSASHPSSRFGQLFGLLAGLVRHNQVILSVSRNGAQALVSVLGVASLLRPRLSFVLVAVGSSLPEVLKNSKGAARTIYFRGLSRCQRVYVENLSIKDELVSLGVSKVTTLPNPRPRTEARWNRESLTGGRFVFVSRVTPEKGVERAMAAIERLRERGVEASLDVIGPLPDSYAQTFHEKLAHHPGSRYLGELKPDEVPATLAGYGALLLPTTWQSEGMPGIIVEAGMIGMPVIASNIPTMAELITDGESGLLVDPDDIDAIASAAGDLLSCPDKAERLAAGLATRVESFEVGAVVSRLSADLVALGWV